MARPGAYVPPDPSSNVTDEDLVVLKREQFESTIDEEDELGDENLIGNKLKEAFDMFSGQY